MRLVCFYSTAVSWPAAALDHAGLPPPPVPIAPYDPADIEVRRAHGAVARAHRIHAFCYRWSDDDAVLARILEDGEPALPFALQVDDRADLDRVAAAMGDARYLREDGRPLVLVDGAATAEGLRARLPVHVVGVLAGDPNRDAPAVWDAACELMPAYATRFGWGMILLDGVRVADAEEAWSLCAGAPPVHPRQYRGLFVGWDTRASGGMVCLPPSPGILRRMVAGCGGEGDPLVFVNAWNAWADGCVLEPDQTRGTAMLQALRDGQDERADTLPLPVSLPVAAVPAEARVVLRIGARDRVWDETAAAAALRPSVAIVDCVPEHPYLAWLTREADVVIVAHLDDDILDLMAGRHAAGLPTILDERALDGDLLVHARRFAESTTWETALERAGSRPRPALPPLGRLSPGCGRFVLGITVEQRMLEQARGLPEPSQAAGVCAELLQVFPRYIQAWRERLRRLNDAGEVEAVLSEGRAILRAAPFHARVRAEVGRALFRSGRAAEAIETLLEAVHGNPGQAVAWVYLLRAAIQTRHPQAAEFASRAVRALPGRELLRRVAAEVVPTDRPAAVEGPFPFGVNFSGPLRSITGLGAGARAMVRVLAAAQIPHVLDNWTGGWAASVGSDGGAFTADAPYAVNLVHANADEMYVWRSRRAARLQGRRSIGMWNWELDRFPEAWGDRFEGLSEIWVPSTFTRASVETASPIPVHVVPYPIEPPGPVPEGFTRRLLGIPDDAFTFFFAFDFFSQTARKNPGGVIEAFRRAFGGRDDVCLMVKCLHPSAGPLQALIEQTRGLRTVRFHLTPLPRAEMDGLVRLCDAFVSLHRSEGYGLPVREAMAAGKPVVATDYGGTTDCLNDENSLPVRWQPVEIAQDVGPYFAGARWAEPDLDHAAACMRRLADDRAFAAGLGERARADIARSVSVDAVAAIVRARLAGLPGVVRHGAEERPQGGGADHDEHGHRA